MKPFLCSGRGALAAALLAAALLAGPALAADPTPAPAATSEPTPTQIDLAKKVLAAAGLKTSIDEIVPMMLSQLQGQLQRIHPEMGKTLHETLLALMPEFNKDEDQVFTDTVLPMAKSMSEAELQQTLAFFDSPAGKKYTLVQGQVLDALHASATVWREKLTTIMLNRTREEMTKKGFPF